MSNCSIYSTDPWYTKWKENKIYEIKNVAIQFSQTQYRFEWGFNCRTSSDYKFPITFLCEGKHFFGKTYYHAEYFLNYNVDCI